MPDANYAPQVTRSGGSNASAPRISDLNRGSFIVHIDRDSQYQLSEICSIVVFR